MTKFTAADMVGCYQLIKKILETYDFMSMKELARSINEHVRKTETICHILGLYSPQPEKPVTRASVEKSRLKRQHVKEFLKQHYKEMTTAELAESIGVVIGHNLSVAHVRSLLHDMKLKAKRKKDKQAEVSKVQRAKGIYSNSSPMGIATEFLNG